MLLDDEFEAKLKIIKKDDETKKAVLQKNTEFKIYNMDTGKYVEQVTTYPTTVKHKSYFTDEDGKQISDIQKIIADKTSDNGAERTFRCQFNLKSLKYSNTATYYLVIADEQGLQMPQREPFQIDIAFAVDEFDFFN